MTVHRVRLRRVITTLGLAGITLISGVLFSLWMEHRSVVTLPEPTGPFAVGRVVYAWTDETTVDSMAPVPGTPRELLVWIWYPAETPSEGTESHADTYLPSVLPPDTTSGGAFIFRLLTKDLAKVHGHSLRDATIAPDKPAYPVAVFRAGASAPVLNYSTLVEDLASHGYIVVGFDAPYRTFQVVFPDGRAIMRAPQNNPELVTGEALVTLGNRLVSAWSRDIAFVLDRLAELNRDDPSGLLRGRVDLTHVGVFGHSLGGATAAQFCHDDPRCTAAVDIDGRPLGDVVRTGLNKPFMFLLSDHGDISRDSVAQHIATDVQSIYKSLPTDTRVRIVMRGAHHFTFSDDGALLKSRILRGVLRVFGGLRLSGRRQLALTVFCVRAFFDAYVKMEDGERPTIVSPDYPELSIED